jgi:hypothetical protein
MPGKSRRGRGKRHHQSKKSKALRRQGMTAAAPPATEQMPTKPKPAPAPPPPKAPETAAARYPYVTGELKRIGILAAIAIVILIIMSAVIT